MPQRAINRFDDRPHIHSAASNDQSSKTRGSIGIFDHKYKLATPYVGKILTSKVNAILDLSKSMTKL